MTNPTLERAARAAAEVYFGPDVAVTYPTSSVWTDVARAVLMAVRDQGINIYHASDPKSHFPGYEAAEGFEDMIDAILAEGE